GFALFFEAWLRQHRNEPDAALRTCEEALGLAEQYGYPHVAGWAGVIRGWAIAKRGAPAEGEAIVRSSLDLLVAIGIKLIRPNVLALHAETLALQYRRDEARRVIMDAIETAERTEERCYLPQIHAIQRELTA